MLPHHVITSVAVLTIDSGHTLDRPLPIPIGAGIFTGRITQGAVAFDIDLCILAPSERPSHLLYWLDARLYDEHATVTGYDLAASAAVLGAMPDTDLSPALCILSDCGHHPLLDTAVTGPDQRIVPFAHVALTAGIPCAEPDPDRAFSAWMLDRRGVLAGCLETDVIACWRLAMQRIGARSALGRSVSAAIDMHLADWLRRRTSPASALHLDSLASTFR